MKEYIKKFASPSAGDKYSIKDIPFMTSVEITGQNLVCNQSGKKLVNVQETLIIETDDPEMVDLGLSVKWAKYNIGATCGDTVKSWYGGFYAWGETETKEDYSWQTYKYANDAYNKLIKYCPTDKTDYWDGTGSPDNKLILDAVDDIATQTYGSNYRMPTKEDFKELIALPNKWVTDFKDISGLNGRIFAKTQTELDGTFNDDTMLFIPAAGNFSGSSHSDVGSACFLLSSSLDSTYPNGAWHLYFYSDNINLSSRNRYNGLSVRCVSKD